MNSRFPLLSFISGLLTWIGWILFVLGILPVVFSAIMLFTTPPTTSSTGFVGGLVFHSVPLLVGTSLVLTGLFELAVAQSIRVFLTIEANTRAASETLLDLRPLLRKVADSKAPPTV
jgi:hypothetical protein